jgi:hypothetical protein
MESKPARLAVTGGESESMESRNRLIALDYYEEDKDADIFYNPESQNISALSHNWAE